MNPPLPTGGANAGQTGNFGPPVCDARLPPPFTRSAESSEKYEDTEEAYKGAEHGGCGNESNAEIFRGGANNDA